MNKFSHNLKILRSIHEISIKELAEKTSLSYNTLSKIESNSFQPNLETVMAVCKYFNVLIDDMLNKSIRPDFYDV